MNAEEKLEKVLAKLKADLQDRNNTLTDAERLEYVKELVSIEKQRRKELGENE
jgi:sensor histidine kinase YesM|tara:strand:- start:707 stop:865 length:159 start_codon:yes stop_codon:yes gene_type:complete